MCIDDVSSVSPFSEQTVFFDFSGSESQFEKFLGS